MKSQAVEHPLKRISFLMALEWGLLLAALGLFTITETYRSFVTVGLGLLAAFFVLRAFRGDLWTAGTDLEIPLALFIASAAVATWIAYDQATALLQFARILATVALLSTLLNSNASIQCWVASGFVLAAVVLAVYWPLQHDFAASPAKFAPIQSAGLWIDAHFPNLKLESLTGASIHSNVAGSILALAIPFGMALTWISWWEGKKTTSVMAGLASLVIASGLVLTSSRGAWLGLVAACGAGILSWVQRRWFTKTHQKILFWSSVVFLILAVLGGLMATGNLNRLVGQLPDPTGSMQSRFKLWRQGLGLIGDYPFTGSGLMTFWMVHSIYGILIHAPYIAHAHNTFLEVWIEQGVVGALALLWGTGVVLSWAWQALDAKKVPLWGWCGFFALVMVAVHGLVDVAFYIERTLPLLGLVLGYAWLSVRDIPYHNLRLSRRTLWISLAGFGILLALTFFSYTPIASAWYSNLGALEQTYQELGHYDPAHFDNPTMDQIRRAIDLNASEVAFNKALALRPDNMTALQRLSHIALSRGEYSIALIYMEKAWSAGYRDDVTRLLYGDALVANGQPEKAAEVVDGLNWAESRLLGQAWYRYWSNQDYQRAADAWQTALLLNPNNQGIAKWIAEARKKLGP